MGLKMERAYSPHNFLDRFLGLRPRLVSRRAVGACQKSSSTPLHPIRLSNSLRLIAHSTYYQQFQAIEPTSFFDLPFPHLQTLHP